MEKVCFPISPTILLWITLHIKLKSQGYLTRLRTEKWHALRARLPYAAARLLSVYRQVGAHLGPSGIWTHNLSKLACLEMQALPLSYLLLLGIYYERKRTLSRSAITPTDVLFYSPSGNPVQSRSQGHTSECRTAQSAPPSLDYVPSFRQHTHPSPDRHSSNCGRHTCGTQHHLWNKLL